MLTLALLGCGDAGPAADWPDSVCPTWFPVDRPAGWRRFADGATGAQVEVQRGRVDWEGTTAYVLTSGDELGSTPVRDYYSCDGTGAWWTGHETWWGGEWVGGAFTTPELVLPSEPTVGVFWSEDGWDDSGKWSVEREIVAVEEVLETPVGTLSVVRVTRRATGGVDLSEEPMAYAAGIGLVGWGLDDWRELQWPPRWLLDDCGALPGC